VVHFQGFTIDNRRDIFCLGAVIGGPRDCHLIGVRAGKSHVNVSGAHGNGLRGNHECDHKQQQAFKSHSFCRPTYKKTRYYPLVEENGGIMVQISVSDDKSS